MAARFPVSGTSVAYRIKPAWASKILVMYWPAGADSVHRIRATDTTSTVLTRSASGATYNASTGMIEGTSTGLFSDSTPGGYGGLKEKDDLTLGAAYYGDNFNGSVASCIFISTVPGTTVSQDGIASGIGTTNYSVAIAMSGSSQQTFGGTNADDVPGSMVLSVRRNVADTTYNTRVWQNGAADTGTGRFNTTATSTDLIGDTARPLYFGGSKAGSGNGKAFFEAVWLGNGTLTDADMAAITANPSIAIEITPAGDVTRPTLSGSITASAITSTSYTLSWPAGSDNVAVTGYEYSVNGGGSYTSAGNVLTVNITGRTAGATDSVAVRAVDAAGNQSTPVLTASVTLLPSGDVTLPVFTGTITASAIATTGYTLSWPAATDNIAVTGYEYSLNGGTYIQLGNVLTVNISGRTPGATDAVSMRAFDAAGNRSTPALSASVTLSVGAGGTLTLAPLKNNTATVQASVAGILVKIFDTTGASIVNKTATADASGVLSINDALLAPGTTYYGLLVHTASGAFGSFKVTAA